nr:MAG TPA: hypothetical protein [Caudoviricetes sp.]
MNFPPAGAYRPAAFLYFWRDGHGYPHLSAPRR